MRTFLTILYLGLLPLSVRGQTLIYPTLPRPAGIRYEVLTTPHTRIFFESGYLQAAREAAALLERSIDSTLQWMGPVDGSTIPVVLNGYNDLANGYVTPLPYKEEIELPELKGQFLSPRHASWLSLVLPHETAHALHARIRAPFGLGSFLYLFGGDANHLLNLSLTPPGISEGIAVLRESIPFLSQTPTQPGRLHYSFFRMRFRATMHSRRPWDLAQLVEPAAYTYPIDRHYIGGTFLMQYLRQTYGHDFFRNVAQRFNRFPLLGYGFTLFWQTKTPPWHLSRAFQQVHQDTIQGVSPPPETILFSRKGAFLYRPRWVDNETLVVYLSPESYDMRAGFYRFSRSAPSPQPIAYETLTEDRYFSLSSDGKRLYFSRYHLDPLVETRAIADVYMLDLARGKVSRISQDSRLFAPIPWRDSLILALQNRASFNDVVFLTPQGNIQRLTTFPRSRFRELLPSLDGKHLMVLLNAEGHQGVFELHTDGDSLHLSPLVLFPTASVYTPSWSSDSRFLLFTADLDGQPEVYALDLPEKRLYRLTHSRFGAFDPTLSPDGRWLAYIDYQHERHQLIVRPFTPTAGTLIPSEKWQPDRRTFRSSWLYTPPIPLPALTPQPYRPGLSWLVPRIWSPIYLNHAPGILLAGTEPIQQWSHTLTLYVKEDRLWGEWMVQTTRFPLRPFLYGRYTPDRQFFRWRTQNDPTPRSGHALYGNRQWGLGIAFPLWLYTSTYRTSAQFSLVAETEHRRRLTVTPSFIELPTDRFPERASRWNLRVAFLLRYRTQRTYRDLRINTGTLLSASTSTSFGEHHLPADQTWVLTLYQYLPVWLRKHHSLRLHAGYLRQRTAGYRDFQAYAPRGYENDVFPDRWYYRMGAEYLLPLAYVDRGLFLIPLYIEALYLYGFVEHMATPVGDEIPERPASWRTRATSVGGGLGIHLRLLYNLRLNLRVGMAYRIPENDWKWIFR